MEPPPFLHHPPRYVPIPRRPPYPPPQNISDDPNFFLPPPQPIPPPPPPQPQSYRPLPAPPPPPSYNPHQSQFNFINHRPIDDDFDFSHRYSSPPRVRVFSDPRPDSWVEPPTALHENLPSVSYDLETLRMGNNNNVGSTFRLRNDHVDCFKHTHTENYVTGLTDTRSSDIDRSYHHGPDYYGPISCGPRNFAFNDSSAGSYANPSRDFGSNSRNYDPFHFSMSDCDTFPNDIDGDKRWRHVQPFCRDHPYNNDSLDSSRQGHHIYESGQFSSRGSSRNRGGNQEFVRSPRKKKVQKKSALLRIQLNKTHCRNRNEEHRLHSANRSDELDPRRFRNRCNRMEEDREASPVELDVSFKSNALIAKAILGSSGHEVEHNMNSTPGKRKRKLANVPSSPLTKTSDGHLDLNIFTYASDCPASSAKDLMQSGDVVSDSACALRCPVGSPEDKIVEGLVSNKGGNTTGPDGTPSSRIKKKKKVTSPLSCPSRQARKENLKPTKAYGSIKSPPATPHLDEDDMNLKQKNAFASIVFVDNFDLQTSQKKETELLEHDKEEESLALIAHEKDGCGSDFGGSHTRNAKRKRNTSSHLFSPPSLLKTKLDEGTVIADRSDDSHTTSSCVNNSVMVSSTTTDFGQMGHASRQFCLSEPSLLVQKSLVRALPGNKLLVGGNIDTNMSILEDTNVQEGTNLYKSSKDGDNVLASEKGQLKITISYNNAFNPVTEIDKAIVVPESFAAEGFPRAITLVEGTVVMGLSNANETSVHGGSSDSNDSIFCKTNYSESNNGPTNFQCKLPVSGISLLEDRCWESFPDGTAVLLENVPMEPPTLTVSGGGNSHVGCSKWYISNVKDGDIGLNLSSPSTSGVLLKEDSKASPVEKTLSYPAKDHSSTGEHVMVPRDVNFFPGSLSCTEKDSIVRSCCLADGTLCSELSSSKGTISGYEPSAKYRKKGKAFASVSSSPMLSEEETLSAGTFTSSAEVPVNTDGGQTPLEDRDVVSKIDTFPSVRSPCSESTILLLENTGAGPSCDAIGLIEDLNAHLLEREQGSHYLPVARGEQKELNAPTPVFVPRYHEAENGGDGKECDAAETVEAQRMLCTVSFQHRNPSETQDMDTYQTQPVSDMECDCYILGKDSSPCFSTALPVYADGNGVLITKFCEKNVESEPDKVSNTGSPETLPVLIKSKISNTKKEFGRISNGRDCQDVTTQDEERLAESPSLSYPIASLRNTAMDKKSSHAMGTVHPLHSKFGYHDSKEKAHCLNSMKVGINARKNLLPSAVPRVFSANAFLKKKAPTSHLAKPRTWHRTVSPSTSSFPAKLSHSSSAFLRGKSPTVIGNVQGASYVRKGNSLVRKMSPVAAIPKASHASGIPVSCLNGVSIDDTKKQTGSESSVYFSTLQSNMRTELNATPERPNTPPLPCNTKISSCINLSSGNGISAPMVDPPQNVCSGTELDPLEVEENMDVLKPSDGALEFSGSREYQASEFNSSESQCLNDENLVSTKIKKLEYVKRKSNQLVAASSSRYLSVQSAGKTKALFSDGYYKRRKNQLIRKSLETVQKVALPEETLKTEGKSASQVIASRSTRSRSGKGLGKSFKPSRFSLVWTLHDAHSLKKENSLLSQVWPHLFPWKRATYRRSFWHNQASVVSDGSLSSISRKLLLSRKRKTIYKRSTRGFSLRMSKVLSVGGSSLKWSKSIERNSRKANEEATLAVAAVERRKREKNGVTDATAQTKSRNHSSRKLVHSIELRPGERIFRVGSVRYKMDPTRRTLQRITDEEPSCSVSLQSGRDVKKSCVPRRLLIGKDEYVRIGNGNQLIRDPKKRTRMLATEKVRWSLHTARMRLARKRKYCQFFTRFGKCIKDDGKCPYIHDPLKIAVCTKFLKGTCSDSNCKLTHKVIPERMQDCSYFLQGLCTNVTCPYRHVNVNPNASICEGFLRGYCADGNECRKKHSYVCPIYEATGMCQVSTCKLHHPRNRKKGKRKHACREQKNARGRYFGSKSIISDSKITVSKKHSVEDDNDVFTQGGRFSDYIHLDVSDEENGQLNPACEQNFSGDWDSIYIDDELIKPLSIMNRSPVT